MSALSGRCLVAARAGLSRRVMSASRRGAITAAVALLAGALCPAQQPLPARPFDATGIVVTPGLANGLVHVEYSENGKRKAVAVPLRNQTRASISATVAAGREEWRYRYSIDNGPEARLPLYSVSLMLPDPPLVTSVADAPYWRHGATRSSIAAATSALDGATYATFFDWYAFDLARCIPPGGELSGFAFASRRLPGIATVYVQRQDLANSILVTLPDEVLQLVTPHLAYDKASQRLYTVAPMIDPDSPMSARLASFQFGLPGIASLAPDPDTSAFARRALGLISALPATTLEPGGQEVRDLCRLASSPPQRNLAKDAAVAIRISLCGANE